MLESSQCHNNIIVKEHVQVSVGVNCVLYCKLTIHLQQIHSSYTWSKHVPSHDHELLTEWSCTVFAGSPQPGGSGTPSPSRISWLPFAVCLSKETVRSPATAAPNPSPHWLAACCLSAAWWSGSIPHLGELPVSIYYHSHNEGHLIVSSCVDIWVLSILVEDYNPPIGHIWFKECGRFKQPCSIWGLSGPTVKRKGALIVT